MVGSLSLQAVTETPLKIVKHYTENYQNKTLGTHTHPTVTKINSVLAYKGSRQEV